MADLKISFFMIVTDRDMVIADHAVRSYARLRGIPFELIIYSNWVLSSLRTRYFPRWRAFDFVRIIENEWQTDERKPTDRRLWGPFDLAWTIWDRELKAIPTPYVATVDADFEILDARFIPVMLDRLDRNPRLAAMSTEYDPLKPEVRDTYSGQVIRLNERWHTWFCIYRREALQIPVSHEYYEEPIAGGGPAALNVWDDAGRLQQALKETYGWELAALAAAYDTCFIHYGAFSHNRHLDERNIRLYRTLKILRKRGLYGRRDLLSRGIAKVLDDAIFGRVDRSTYVSGWAIK